MFPDRWGRRVFRGAGKALESRAQIALGIDKEIGGCHDFLAGLHALDHLHPLAALRAVHTPVLRGNPSVSRPVLPPLKFRDDQLVAVSALVDDDVEADVAVLAADPRVASALPAAKAANGAAAAERARPAAVAAAPHRLGGLFSWLTSPRFLHRNS